ncbi:TPA: DUF551 domain-containing protein [Klebsiella quasipneumoniae]
MTKSTITRERAQQIFLGNGPEPSASEERELARMALIAMDSEPCTDDELSNLLWYSQEATCHSDPNYYCEFQRLATPGFIAWIIRELQERRKVDSEPVAVTDDMAYAFHHALTDSMIGADDVEEIKTGLRAVFANLTAPVVSAEYPDMLPCSVLLEPGLRFGKGIKTSTMLAALARRAVYESDMAALSPEERAEFQARIEDFKSLIAQPAPVVPDGYVMVPKEPTKEMIDAGWLHYMGTKNPSSKGTYKAMLAAAPQSPGSEPATVPGKWVPVSEKMPPSRHEVLVGRWWGEKPRWCCKWATYIPGHPDAQSSGWLIPGASWTPTHWMPLPAAPQEVKP